MEGDVKGRKKERAREITNPRPEGRSRRPHAAASRIGSVFSPGRSAGGRLICTAGLRLLSFQPDRQVRRRGLQAALYSLSYLLLPARRERGFTWNPRPLTGIEPVPGCRSAVFPRNGRGRF